MTDTEPQRQQDTASLSKVWAIDEDLIRHALTSSSDLLRLVRDLDNQVPIPFSRHAYAEGPMFRLPGSHRAVYRSLDDDPAGHGVLAIKGAEPLSPDFAAMLEDMRRRCYTPHSIAQHLVMEEGKVPGCLSLQEALAEAEASATVQRRHVSMFVEVARVPLALRVYQLSAEVVAGVEARLADLLAPLARRRAHELLSSGLGVLVYHYPSPPVRVRDLDTMLPEEFRSRQVALADLLDVERLVRAWVDLFVRLLVLGLLPGGLASLRTGVCCQPQNACLDGGFVDLDSVVDVSDASKARDLTEALAVSLQGLIDSALTLVGGGEDREGSWTGSLERSRVSRWVESLVQESLAQHRSQGRTVPHVIERQLAAPSSYAALVNELSPLHDLPDPASRTAAVEFSQDARKLLRRALQDGAAAAQPTSAARVDAGQTPRGDHIDADRD